MLLKTRFSSAALIALLCLFILAGYIFSHSETLEVDPVNPPTRLLDSMKRETKIKSLLPGGQSSEFSEVIYDLRFKEGQRQLNLGGVFNEASGTRKSIRIKLPESEDVLLLKFSAPSTKNPQSKIVIRDNLKRIIYTCDAGECAGANISLAPGTRLIRLQFFDYPINAGEPSLYLSIVNSVPVEKRPLLPSLFISLDALQDLQFTSLHKKAIKQTAAGNWDIPNNRLSASIRCCEIDSAETAHARISLSGRNPGHFETFPPSMSVSITKGNLILGAKNFKLYRPTQRQGLADHVVHSILEDFGVLSPPQRIVKVYVDRAFAGFFIFEETYSTGFLENLEVSEGNIFGYDTDWFFREYPDRIRLKVDRSFKGPHPTKRAALNLMMGKDFSMQLDEHSFIYLIAITSLFDGTHGLGADDLRFYENPLTKKFFPIARDLKIGAWPEALTGFDKSFHSHFSFLSTGRGNSMQPFLNLTRNGKATSEGYSGETLGVWDLHPAILSFLSNRENRIEFEKVILGFIGSGIFADFRRRLRAAATVVKSSPPALQIEPPLKNHEELEWTIEGQLSLIDDQDNFYLGDSIRKLIKKTPLLYASGGDGSWTIFNRLPFHIFFDSTTSNCKYQGNRSILGPSSRSYSVKSADVNLTQISKLYSQNKRKDAGSSPLCTVDVDPSLLSFSLADGSLITLEALPQSDPTDGNNKTSKSKQTSEPFIDLTKASERSGLHISECFRAYVETFEDLRAAYDLVSSTVSIQNWGRTHLISFGQEEGRIPKLSSPCDTTLGTYLNNHTAVLSFLDSENSSTHSRTRFLLVLGDKLNWNEKALPIYSADGVTIRNLQTSTILRDASKNERSLSKSASDIFAELLTRLTTTINQKSIIFDIVIPRSNNPQYYRVTEASVRAAVSGNIEQLFILHAKESIVPPLGEKLPAAPQKAISEVEDIRLLAQPINSVVFIKKDQELVLGPNDRLEFGPKGVIFVEGLLSIRGSEENPVRLTATEDSWGGIILLGSKRDNIIEHADISKVKGWEPFLGGITAINASLRIVNSSIHNFDSEDAINAHHSRLEIISSTIEHSASDCVDADFSYGEIIETNVRNCGGDGLDMNHSYFFMSQNTLESNADKGLSCGEKSTCAFQDNILRNNDVDIAVKDASILIANQNQFIESNTGIATFIKKPWYSPPYVVESNNRFSGTDVHRINLGFFRY